MLVLALIFVSPLCALSSALSAGRALHHVLPVAVAAPLPAAALPARQARAPARAFLAATAALRAWHLPAAYDLALSAGRAMQLSLLLPLADQQLGGLVMWGPAGLPYAAVAALLARRAWRAEGGVAA